MSSSVDYQPLALSVLNAKGWDNKMRALVLASKQLPILDADRRTSENLVKGCDSEVWLDRDDSTPTLKFVAYSPSKVIRGVLAVILEQAHAVSTDSLKTFDFDDFSERIALSRFLSQSRGNGLRQVVSRIQKLATT
ncbi:SufE family protein [Alteromonas ponticola]|uniref:SufE family protein n=1 Tax=Alteromonas aquimaris TaxID=2998417 RepID=A0ABT3P7L6_9ALTE|nr:SufE family protein [Alteromonas aquimaris]MCW8108758.1 SufE family protein [Alteromonas aquimaris]